LTSAPKISSALCQLATEAKAARRAAVDRPPPATAAEVLPPSPRRGFAARRRHRPDARPRSRSATSGSLSPEDAHELRLDNPIEYVKRPGRGMARHVDRWSNFSIAAPRCSITATAFAAEARLVASARAFEFPGFVPAYIRPLFCEGTDTVQVVALSGDPRWTLRPPTEPWSRVLGQRGLVPLESRPPVSESRSRACPRASAGWDMENAPAPACGFNELVRSGAVKAPIVIGRDHLDSGSVASP